jgi:hypothetical protein
VIAAIRPDEVNFPLLLHVLGAMLLVGTVFAVAIGLFLGWRRADPALDRFGLLTLLVGVLPSYVLMRIGAQWTESEENLPDDFEAAWLDTGYVIADLSVPVLVVSAILAGFGLRRLRAGGGSSLARSVGVIAVLLLAAYLVAVWAMTAKPD